MNEHNLAFLLMAMVLERCFGYPEMLLKRIGHPVMWMGFAIGKIDKIANTQPEHPASRASGLAAMLVLVLGAVMLSVLMVIAAGYIPYGGIVSILLIASLMAYHSLQAHVEAVHCALGENLALARSELAKIVGRDTQHLSEQEVAVGAIESLAESFCDGVVAPVFYAALLGLPGVAAYKMINTADSMIGHKDTPYRYFGWAAARLDDVANFIPARLAALLILLGALCVKMPVSRQSFHIIWRDARKHASPNAGWPETAMAAVLGVQLGGEVQYGGVAHPRPLVGEGGKPKAQDISRALQVYEKSHLLLMLPLLLLVCGLI